MSDGRTASGAASSRGEGVASLDEKLMTAIDARDPRALAALYDRHAPAVLGLCLRILGDRPEAEEALLDVFTQVWEQSERYDSERATPGGWLMLLARSRAIDRLRARRSRLRRADRVRDAEPERSELEASTPLADAIASERSLLVRGALRELGASQRELIELSFFQGLSHSEIADRQAIPLGTVKTRIRQGMRRLRRLLDDDDPERGA